MTLVFTSTESHHRPRKVVFTIIAHLAGAVVGEFKVEYSSSEAYLEDVWVEKPHRGRGFGDELVKQAKAHARARGHSALLCDPIAYERNPDGSPGPALPGAQARLEKLYANSGFVKLPDPEDGGRAQWAFTL